MNINWEVKAMKKVKLYKSPTYASSEVGFLGANTIIVATQKMSTWYYIKEYDGWCDGKGGVDVVLVRDLDGGSSIKDAETNTSDTTTNTGDSTASTSFEPYEPNLDSYNGIGANLTSSMSFKEIKGIFGLPYQYMEEVDRRLSNNSGKMHYGRKFASKIIVNAPLLFLTPGKPKFMSGYSDKYKKNIVTQMLDTINGAIEGDIQSLLDDKDGKYYDFEFAYSDYFYYVNTMCQNAARFLGIGDEKFNGTKLASYDWSKYNNSVNSQLGSFVSGSEYVCFYIESENQISESFSTSTGESMLASGFNSLSDMGKEVNFLLGSAASTEINALTNLGTMPLDAINQFVGKYSNPNGIVEKLRTSVSTLAVGGQMLFPEIWKDSEYSKSYDVTVKLISPDGDNKSIFLNILVPMYHLLALVLPRGLGANGYSSPFIVRGFYKGFFNCDMGIVTNLNITKGTEGAWNINGLPTQMDIQISLKDLYQCLSMTPQAGPDGSVKAFLKNTPFVDFLANSVGININKPALFRTMSMYGSMTGTNITSVPSNIGRDFSQYLSNAASRLSIW